MLSPRVVLISAVAAVPESELGARLERARAFPDRARARAAVELRDPDLDGRSLWALGERLRARTRELGISLLVNDRIDLALALGADGVHLGRRSVDVADAVTLLGPGAWVSVSAHSLDDVAQAADRRASAVVLSPIFETPGKGPPLGLGALNRARAILDARPPEQRPWLIALGGIDATRALEARAAGADGVAAIRADLLAARALLD